MSSKIEDLVIELWLEVFSYLKLQHQFKAFFDLNKRLNGILFSYRTHLNCRNNDDDCQYLFKYILPYLPYRDKVNSLRLENTKKIGLIDKIDLVYFPRLTTLSLHRLHITEDLLRIFQQNTTHLRYLHVSSVISGDRKSLHRLLEMIISLPNLQSCRLRVGISMSSLPFTISSTSPMKDLRLLGKNEHVLTNRLITLLQYLPCLQSLHINANQLNFTPDFQVNVCPARISIFTLNLNQLNVSLPQLTSCISILTPYVVELKIIHRSPMENLTYLNRHEWIKFIQSLPNLNKFTLDIHRHTSIDESLWNKHCQILTKSIAKHQITFRIDQ